MRRLERVAALLAFLAAGLHVLATPGHLEEWWGAGLFFLAAAAALAGLGLLLLTQGIEGWGGWSAVRRRVYLGGLVLAAVLISVWLLSRTVGLPFGPEAWEAEPVGPLDAASKMVEVALAAVLGRLACGPPDAE